MSVHRMLSWVVLQTCSALFWTGATSAIRATLARLRLAAYVTRRPRRVSVRHERSGGQKR